MILASQIKKIELSKSPHNRRIRLKRGSAEMRLKQYLEEKYGRLKWVNHILTSLKRIIMN